MNVFITKSEIASLSWAVKEADSLRGGLIDKSNPQMVAALEAYDNKMKKAKMALKKMRSAIKAAEGDVCQKPSE